MRNAWDHIEIFWLQTWRTWAQFETPESKANLSDVSLESFSICSPFNITIEISTRSDWWFFFPLGDAVKGASASTSVCVWWTDVVWSGQVFYPFVFFQPFTNIRFPVMSSSACVREPISTVLSDAQRSDGIFLKCPRWKSMPQKKRQDAGTLISSASPQIKRICREKWRDCEGTHDK